MTDPKAPKTVQLSDPVEWGDRKVTEVTINKPKVKDLERMEAMLEGVEKALDQAIVTASAITGLPVEVVKDLDLDDFTAISEVIAGFFPQATASRNGEASLPKPPTG